MTISPRQTAYAASPGHLDEVLRGTAGSRRWSDLVSVAMTGGGTRLAADRVRLLDAGLALARIHGGNVVATRHRFLSCLEIDTLAQASLDPASKEAGDLCAHYLRLLGETDPASGISERGRTQHEIVLGSLRRALGLE